MRLSVGLMLGLLLGVPPLAGCGPAIPPEELGTVLEEVPEIPGSEKPFEFPESDPSPTPGPPKPGPPKPGPPKPGAETPESAPEP